MTLIAGFSVRNIPILISDILISTRRASDSVTLPSTGRIEQPSLSNHGLYVAGGLQKTAFIGDNIAVAWSGNAARAKYLLGEMACHEEENPFNLDSFGAYIETLRDHRVDGELAMVGYFREDNRIYPFEFNGHRVEDEALRDVVFAGSGSEQFRERVLSRTNELISDTGEGFGVDYAIHAALNVVTILWAREVFGNTESLDDGFGGAYEISICDSGRWSKLGDVAFLFWKIAVTDGRVSETAQLLPRMLKFAYEDKVLVVRSTTLVPGETTRSHLHLVPPLYPRLSQVQRDTLERTLETPPMDSHFLWNTIWFVDESTGLGVPSGLLVVGNDQEKLVRVMEDGKSITVDGKCAFGRYIQSYGQRAIDIHANARLKDSDKRSIHDK